MIFPYGEWVLLFLTLLTWTEKRDSRRFFLILTIAWLLGKGAEIGLAVTVPWHWNLARLAVMMVFWVWALQRTKRRFIPLFFTTIIVGAETLFVVNEPGVFPYVSWLFAVVLISVAWLTTKSYWGTAAALTGSALLNLAFVRFTYDGIIRYVDLPSEFVWNLGVGLFTVWSGLGLVRQFFTERKLQAADVEFGPSNSGGNYEQLEERKLP